MKRTVFLLLSVLTLICCWLKPVSAQIQIQTVPQKKERPTLSDKIEEHIRNRQAAEDRYIAEFLKLPPQQRIAEWKKRDKIGGLVASRKEDALIALGTDTVPFLIEIIHDKHSSHQLRALEILCDMDRFVRAEDTPLPEVAGTFYIKEFKLRGILNRFMLVDGRRIGKTGYDAIMWAAEQTKDKELRFHARHQSGLLEQDLRKLPLNEQFSRWKTAAAKSKGFTGDWDAAILEFYLSQIIIEQAPETLPAIIDTLQHESNAYVREEALIVLTLINRCHFRLRASALGRKALDVMHQALEEGNLKPVFTKNRKEWREKEWQSLYTEAMEDKERIDPTANLTLF